MSSIIAINILLTSFCIYNDNAEYMNIHSNFLDILYCIINLDFMLTFYIFFGIGITLSIFCMFIWFLFVHVNVLLKKYDYWKNNYRGFLLLHFSTLFTEWCHPCKNKGFTSFYYLGHITNTTTPNLITNYIYI